MEPLHVLACLYSSSFFCAANTPCQNVSLSIYHLFVWEFSFSLSWRTRATTDPPDTRNQRRQRRQMFHHIINANWGVSLKFCMKNRLANCLALLEYFVWFAVRVYESQWVIYQPSDAGTSSINTLSQDDARAQEEDSRRGHYIVLTCINIISDRQWSSKATDIRVDSRPRCWMTIKWTSIVRILVIAIIDRIWDNGISINSCM